MSRELRFLLVDSFVSVIFLVSTLNVECGFIND
jgi:hypothetical protein